MSLVVDAFVREGCSRIDASLKERIANWVEAQRLPDGGFPGRSGGSDPYYTDFALRLLSCVRPSSVSLSANVEFGDAPKDVPEGFNRASIAFLCSQPMPSNIEPVLTSFRLPSGCYSRHSDSTEVSAYATFLGALCEDALGLFHEPTPSSFEAILSLQQSDGGFIDTVSTGSSQSNATAAAVGYLLRGSYPDALDRAVGYLKKRQFAPLSIDVAGSAGTLPAKSPSPTTPPGGFYAHDQSEFPDLLTTFTALATLSLLGSMDGVDLKAHARFVGSLATPEGGFRSCTPDPESDIEYAYYGLGCLALIWLNV
jgi:geranylgeranyl transferase type-2 subunit beta